MPERPQTLRHCTIKNKSSAEAARSRAEGILKRPFSKGIAVFGSPFFAPKGVRKGFFRGFQGDSMHFRGHSRRNAPFLPPFVVYYGHRAVLCFICHSRNSYRAESRPVTANRAVFCFMRARAVRRGVSAHLRGDSCPKSSKAGKTWYTGYNKKRPAWKGA